MVMHKCAYEKEAPRVGRDGDRNKINYIFQFLTEFDAQGYALRESRIRNFRV
jgi:hypothetical protein